MIIRGIFTNTKLSPTRMNSETTVPYIVANECPGLKRVIQYNLQVMTVSFKLSGLMQVLESKKVMRQ